MFFISNLVRIGSGILRNMFKSYFCLSDAPAGAIFSEKWHISRILDMTNLQKMTFKLLLSVGRSRRGFFFWKMTHFYNFGHVKSSRNDFKATFVCRLLPQGLFFLKNYTFPYFLTWQFPQKCVFNQKLDFWGHKLSKYRHFCAYIRTLDQWPFHKKN